MEFVHRKMNDLMQVTVNVTRNYKASEVGLLTTTALDLANILSPVHTNDAIQIMLMISGKWRADILSIFFPVGKCSDFYICAVYPALDFYITKLLTVFVMS